MTDQAKLSPADICGRALEKANAERSPEEFKLFFYMFNMNYLTTRFAAGEVPKELMGIMNTGLVSPLIHEFIEKYGISRERAEEVNEETKILIQLAFATGHVPEEEAPQYPGVYGLIIDRARAEGFEAPTLEQMEAATANAPFDLVIDWDSVYAAERFHFQAVLRRILDGKPVHMKFMK